MASLYQRFNGKINTSNSFPNPPEASHLLGQGGEVEPAAESLRPRLQHPHSRHNEDEDVRICLTFTAHCQIQNFSFLRHRLPLKMFEKCINVEPPQLLILKAKLSKLCVIAASVSE